MRTKFLARLALAATLCLVLGLATTASAISLPAAGIYVGDAFAPFVVDPTNSNHFTATGSLGSTTFSAGATFTDPSIAWSVDTSNGTAAPVGVTVVFGPFATPGFPAPIVLKSTSGVSLTDGGGAAGASIAPLAFDGFPIDGIATNYTSDAAVTAISNHWGTDPGFSFLTADDTQVANFSFGPASGSGSPNDAFFEIVSFTLSANDTTGLSGNCRFDAVPIPPSVLLFGSGMLGMGLLGWRRRLS